VIRQELVCGARGLERRVGVRRRPLGQRRSVAVRFALGAIVVAAAVGAQALVLPAGDVVGLPLGVEPGEETVEIFGVAEVLGDDRRRIGVGDDVLAEVLLIGEDV